MALTVIITELTNDTHFILPIMVAIMVRIYASIVNRLSTKEFRCLITSLPIHSFSEYML